MASTTAATMRAAAPRQSQLLPHIKESFEHAVQGFWNALKKQRAAWKPSGGSSCMPSLPFRRNGHFSSLVNKIATWPRLASRMASRERSSSSPNAQQPGSPSPAAAVAACRYSLSFPGPGLPSASLTVLQSSRTKYSSNIFEHPRQQQTASSSIEEEDGQEEELQAAPGTSTNASENSTPIYIASPDSNDIFWEVLPEMQDYILKGIMEVQQITNCCAAPEMSSHGTTASWFESLADFDCEALTIIRCNSEAEHDGAGDYSSVTTVSEENGTASSSAASQELLALENGTASSSAAPQELLQEPPPAAAAAVQEQGATAAAPRTRFKGIRQKDNKWIAEIRPSCSKKTVWLGTYKTQEEAALAYDAGIFYYKKFAISYNFPDSPNVLPAIKEGPQDVSTKFVKTQAWRNAQRAWSSSSGAAQQQQALSSSASSSLGWSNPCKKRKTNSRCCQ